MNFINKIQAEYEQLWKYIVRPERTTYPQAYLGPAKFRYKNIIYKRVDF
jgi:hypothetical protein